MKIENSEMSCKPRLEALSMHGSRPLVESLDLGR